MGVAVSVVGDAGVPPELVEAKGAAQHVGVVQLVVVADPAADESPGSLDARVSAEASGLLGLAAWTRSNHKTVAAHACE